MQSFPKTVLLLASGSENMSDRYGYI